MVRKYYEPPIPLKIAIVKAIKNINKSANTRPITDKERER